MSDLQKSRICRDGAPDVRHPGCTGCLGCPCHHVTAPASVRAEFEAAREAARAREAAERQDGAA